MILIIRGVFSFVSVVVGVQVFAMVYFLWRQPTWSLKKYTSFFYTCPYVFTGAIGDQKRIKTVELELRTSVKHLNVHVLNGK